MHYKNGREVKLGDRVVGIINGMPKASIVIDMLPNSDACNIALVPAPDQVYCSWQSKEFIHIDDLSEFKSE